MRRSTFGTSPAPFLTAFPEDGVSASEPVVGCRNGDREVLGFQDDARSALAVTDPASEEPGDLSQSFAPMMYEGHLERRDVVSCEDAIGLEKEADTELRLLAMMKKGRAGWDKINTGRAIVN